MKTWIKKLFFGSEIRPTLLKIGLLRGMRFYVDPMHHSQRLIGIEEAEIANVMRRFAPRVKTAVDVGANDGWYSLFFARQPNIEKVCACEPDTQHLDKFQRNLALNEAGSKIELIPFFIGRTNGENVRSLDEMLETATGPILIKIDVDGAELDVLAGAQKLLAGRRVLLIVETHSFELEKACVNLLAEAGYQCSIIKNGWYRLFIPEQRPIPHNRWLSAEPINELSYT